MQILRSAQINDRVVADSTFETDGAALNAAAAALGVSPHKLMEIQDRVHERVEQASLAFES